MTQNPMDNASLGLFFENVGHQIQNQITGKGTLHLEQCSLHTEHPDTAKQAPDQVRAAVKRGATVIGFTELNPGHVNIPTIRQICTDAGYHLLFGGKPGSETGLAFKQKDMAITKWQDETTPGGSFLYLTGLWQGNTVTVVEQHFAVSPQLNALQAEKAARTVMTEAKGNHLAFLMGDPNAHLKNANDPFRKMLENFGVESIYQRLNSFPVGGSDNPQLIANYVHDRRVKPAQVVTIENSLGSDHKPVGAYYDVS